MARKNACDITITPAVTGVETPAGVADTPATAGGGDGRIDALWAALMATPGMSATLAGAAVGMSRATVGKILTQLEADGRATRVPGGYGERGRTPDTWHAITPAAGDHADTDTVADVTSPSGDEDISGAPDAHPAAPETSGATSEPDGHGGGRDADSDTGRGDVVEPGENPGEDMDRGDTMRPEAIPDADLDVAPGSDTADAVDAVDAVDLVRWRTGVAVPAPRSGDATPAQVTPESSDGEAVGDTPEGPHSADDVHEDEALTEPSDDHEADDLAPVETGAVDPAWAAARKDLIEFAELVLGTVTAAEAGDVAGALGRLELLSAGVSRVRRDVRAVLTGTKRASTATRDGVAPSRPGQLRDRVLDHLNAHPGKDFTPYEIGRVLGNSSGAVANALDRLVSLGEAVLTSERPRRFTATTTAATVTATSPAVTAVTAS